MVITIGIFLNELSIILQRSAAAGCNAVQQPGRGGGVRAAARGGEAHRALLHQEGDEGDEARQEEESLSQAERDHQNTRRQFQTTLRREEHLNLIKSNPLPLSVDVSLNKIIELRHPVNFYGMGHLKCQIN